MVGICVFGSFWNYGNKIIYDDFPNDSKNRRRKEVENMSIFTFLANATLEGALTALSSVITFLIGFFTQILGLFVTSPTLLIFLGIFVCGAIIGLVTRVVRSA
jgi:hypothetical protein